MLLKEYDEVFHITSEKDISFKEGQESEHINTERERKNAERERKNAEREKQRADALQLQNTILTYKLQGKNEEMIAKLTNCTIGEVQAALSSITAD